MKRILGASLALTASLAFGATLTPIQLLNPTGSSSGQAIVSTGSSSAPAWGGIGVNGIAAIAANTVLANATASSASPTAFAMPSCSTSSSALDWTTSTGFTCNTSVNAATLGGTTFAAPGPIGSTTASTGAFTTLSATSTVSGTGFSTYLASPPAIGTTAAAAGKFTTLQATSTITPSTTAGIVGTTLADSAQAGSVGEILTNSTSATSATSGTALNGTSKSLTAGDWDVTGFCQTNPAATTVTNSLVAGISTTSATFSTVAAGINNYSLINGLTQPAGNLPLNLVAPTTQVNVSTTTTVFLVCQAGFSTSTLTISGWIRARRVR